MKTFYTIIALLAAGAVGHSGASGITKQTQQIDKNQETIDKLKQEVISHFRYYFKDPDSAQFDSLRYYPRTLENGILEQHLCGDFNIKNGYGAYVGYRPFVLTKHDGGSANILFNSEEASESQKLNYEDIKEKCHK